ncbi:unnamed protein product [Meganyctiphanes norvegica]|uniref:Uncharacterized protein n=1 Tax=Meganyctiphanes norvegica TaxID=48144 RepID=A0AAV2QHW4_MEGNR
MSFQNVEHSLIREDGKLFDISKHDQNKPINNSMLSEVVCVTKLRTTSSAEDDSENYLSLTEEDGNDAYVTQSRKYTSKQNIKNRIYNCDICDKHFSSPAHLSEHKISHSTLKKFTCSMCAKTFKRKNALLKHIRKFHNSEIFKCSCGKRFSTKKAVQKHKDDGHCQELLNCSECGACYKTRISLDCHLLLHKFEQKNITNTKWPYTCPICSEYFSSSTSLSNHISDKHSQETLRCHYCNKAFRTKQLLRHHLLRKHRYDPSSICTCSVCNKEFSMTKDLRRHMLSHNIGRFCDCLVCGSKFKSFRLLQSHMKLHSQGKPYDCLICFIPFESLACLQEHLTNFHKLDIDDESFSQTWNRKCPICGQLFLRRSATVAHMKSHMDNENTKVILVEEKDEPISFVDNSNNRSTHNDMYVHVIEVCEQNVEDHVNSDESKSEKLSFMELINNHNSMETDKMFISSTFNLDTSNHDEKCFSQKEGSSGNEKEKSHNNPIDIAKSNPDFIVCSNVNPNAIYNECNDKYMFVKSSNDIDIINVKSTSEILPSSVKVVNDSANTVSIEKLPKNICEVYEYQAKEYHVNENMLLESSEIQMNESPKYQNKDSLSIETSDSQFIDVHEAEKSELPHSEETTYICGQCSLVFTNVNTLQSHIINCYNQETSEEYVVVFEAEEDSK